MRRLSQGVESKETRQAPFLSRGRHERDRRSTQPKHAARAGHVQDRQEQKWGIGRPGGRQSRGDEARGEAAQCPGRRDPSVAGLRRARIEEFADE